MKKTKLFLLLTCFSLAATAQQDFQGSVRYEVTKPTQMEESEDSIMNITMHLAPNRILFSVDNKKEENILIMFDSLKIVKLDKENNTYRTQRIYKASPMPADRNETIAGYRTTLQQTDGGTGFGTNIHPQLWAADDLMYRLPAGVYINEFMMFFQNERIVLKAVLHIGSFGFEDEPEEDTEGHSVRNFNADVVMKAVEVIPGVLPAGLFEIPPGYTKQERHFPKDVVYPPAAMDSAMMDMPDTTVAITEPPPPPQKKQPTKTPVKTKTKTSSPARKDD